MAQHCSEHGIGEGQDDNGNTFGTRYPQQQGVGTHLSHLNNPDLSQFLDRWKNYDKAEDETRLERVRG